MINKNKSKLTIIFFISAGLAVMTAQAQENRIIGPVYPITENDFIEMAQDRFKQAIDSDKKQREPFAAVIASADRPTPVFGLTPALYSRQWAVTPSIVLPIDLKDAGGHILLAAGSVFNPLKTYSWSKALLFFDADNAAQLQWAASEDQVLNGQDILILTNGSLRTAMRYFNHSKTIYFDQGGRFIDRLQITHLPAIARQSGEALQVREIKI